MIKKRMLMMTKKRTPSLAAIKLLVAIPVAALIFLAISAYREIPEPQAPAPADVSATKESEPFTMVEQMPVFPGGDVALLKYIAENTSYPERAKESNIQGRVILRFCITENGSVSRVSVLSGVDPDLDAEAVRVVKTLPSFNPGRQGGKAVSVWYMVPITFSLK
jgi:protein TonB